MTTSVASSATFCAIRGRPEAISRAVRGLIFRLPRTSAIVLSNSMICRGTAFFGDLFFLESPILYPHLRILSEPARQQLAAFFEDGVGRRRDMRVDPLQVAQQVEVKRTGLTALHPAGANATEMRLGCAGFEIAEPLLLAKQSARRANVVSHEHGGGRAHI